MWHFVEKINGLLQKNDATLKDCSGSWVCHVSKMLTFELSEMESSSFEYSFYAKFDVRIVRPMFNRYRKIAVKIKILGLVELWLTLAQPNNQPAQLVILRILKTKRISENFRQIALACVLFSGKKFPSIVLKDVLLWLQANENNHHAITKWLLDGCPWNIDSVKIRKRKREKVICEALLSFARYNIVFQKPSATE